MVGERAEVGLKAAQKDGQEGVTLGKNVLVEAGAVVEARGVGEGSVVGVGVRVGMGVVVGKV